MIYRIKQIGNFQFCDDLGCWLEAGSMSLYNISAWCGHIWKGTRSGGLPFCCVGPCCGCCCWCCNCWCDCCCAWIIVPTFPCPVVDIVGTGLTVNGWGNKSVGTIGTGTVRGRGRTFTPCTLLDVGNCTFELFVLHLFICWHVFVALYGMPDWKNL